MGKDLQAGAKALAREFGRLVANHRRRLGWSQEKLADYSKISPSMLAKIESGATGVRFPTIVQIAAALDVEPAALFSSQFPQNPLNRGKRRELIVRIEELTEDDLNWAYDLLAVALRATGRRSFELGAVSSLPRTPRAKSIPPAPKRSIKS
jgi:transcriptional regulator with XRE-family HTH domain